MNEHEHIAVITCHKCGQRAELKLHDVIDSKENAYEKNQILNGTLFEHKCSKCGESIVLLYELAYVDADQNIEIYLAHDGHLDGARMMLQITDAIERKHKAQDNACQATIKRIVTCCHKLREKVLIFDAGFDDRIIEIVKIICMNNAAQNIPDLDPVCAEFDIRDGKYIINVFGEENSVTAMIPDGLYDQLAEDFKNLLIEDNSYVVDELWAMEAMGIDPYEDGCDGDCEHCLHQCDDDLDDFADADERCDDWECNEDCDNCPCDNCNGEDYDNSCATCEHNCLNWRGVEDDDE